MGGSNSTELLHAPLHAQPTPFRWSDRSMVPMTSTTLRIQIPMLRSTAQVYNHDTNQILYEIKYGMLATRVTLQTPDGTALFTIKNKTLRDYYRVYEGANTDLGCYKIQVKDRGVLSPLLVCAEFEDKVSRTHCRVLVEGCYSNKVSLVYLERGSPNLSKLEKQESWLSAVPGDRPHPSTKAEKRRVCRGRRRRGSHAGAADLDDSMPCRTGAQFSVMIHYDDHIVFKSPHDLLSERRTNDAVLKPGRIFESSYIASRNLRQRHNPLNI